MTMFPQISTIVFALAALLSVAEAHPDDSAASVMGVRILLDEGRRSGLGNPCSENERELMKRAFRLAISKKSHLVHTRRQPLSCSYLCEGFANNNCFLAHPKCSAERMTDEKDHHGESEYPDSISIQKFEGDHMIDEEICDTAMHSQEDINDCNEQKVHVRDAMENYLESHLSPTCARLLRRKVDFTCFRL